MTGKDSYKYGQYYSQNQETRWATIDEIKNASSYIDLNADNYPASGLPLLSNGREAYVDNSDTHSLIFGATGSKKTRLFCMPLINILIKAGESFIATDPKGELYAKTSGLAEKMGYKTVVLNFRDIGKGDRWNPLALPYELYHAGHKDEAASLLSDFITTIVEPVNCGKNDMFWMQTSRSLGLAHMLLLMEYARPDEAHMASFVPLCTNSVVSHIQENLEILNDSSLASVNYRSVLAGSEITTQNIVVSLFAAAAIFSTQKNLCNMLSENTFDIRNFGREKTALYLIIPDEKTTLHFLVTTFIKQAYEILIREAQKEPDLRLPVRVNFVLDEFCNIPQIPDMPAMISAARSRNMRYFLVVQSKHQLVGKYGEDAETIKGNCDNWVFLTSKELDLLKEISELCGSVRNPDGRERRLISVSELQRLDKEKGEALIMHAREYPIITEMADIDDYKMFGKEKPAPMRRMDSSEAPVFNSNYFFTAYACISGHTDKKLFDLTREEFIGLLSDNVQDIAKKMGSSTRIYLEYFGITGGGERMPEKPEKKEEPSDSGDEDGTSGDDLQSLLEMRFSEIWEKFSIKDTEDSDDGFDEPDDDFDET